VALDRLPGTKQANN